MALIEYEEKAGDGIYRKIAMKQIKTAMEKEFPDAEGLVLDARDGVGGMAHRPLCNLLDSTAADRIRKHPACTMRIIEGLVTDYSR